MTLKGHSEYKRVTYITSFYKSMVEEGCVRDSTNTSINNVHNARKLCGRQRLSMLSMDKGRTRRGRIFNYLLSSDLVYLIIFVLFCYFHLKLKIRESRI